MVLALQVEEKRTSYTAHNQVREKPTDHTEQNSNKEKPKVKYTKHDLLFKQLINNFFEEFLEAFFLMFMNILILPRLHRCRRRYIRILLMERHEGSIL